MKVNCEYTHHVYKFRGEQFIILMEKDPERGKTGRAGRNDEKDKPDRADGKSEKAGRLEKQGRRHMDEDRLISSLADIAAESFRLKGVFLRAIRHAEFGEYNKYVSQFGWFEKKVNRALEEAGLTVVDLSGRKYDPGMAVTPLNIEDFETDSGLVIDRMMEPVIMKEDRLIRTGTVILREEGTDG